MKNLLLTLFLFAITQATEITQFDLITQKNSVDTNDIVTVYANLELDGRTNFATPQFPASEEYTILNVQKHNLGMSQTAYSGPGGKLVTSTSYSYRFIYQIQFKRIGKISLPPLSLTVDGKTKLTKKIVFTVGGSEKSQKPISVHFNGKKRAIYEGERHPFTIQIRTSLTNTASFYIEDLNQLYAAIEKEFSQKIKFSSSNEWQIEKHQDVINGIPYMIYELPLIATFIEEGLHKKGALTFNYHTTKRARDRHGFPYTQKVQEVLKTPSLTFEVKKLPPRPKGFTGALSKINLTGKISQDTTTVGEGITLQYTLSGNVPGHQLGDIPVPNIPNTELFTPEKSSRSDTTKTGISSKMSFRYILSPTKAGTVQIPEVVIPWFDTKSGTYKEAKTGPFTLTVLKGEGAPQPTTRRYLTKETLQTVGEDIRAIKTSRELSDISPRIYRHKGVQFFLLFPWIMALCAVLLKVKLAYFPTDIDKTQKRQALGRAQAHLKKIASGKTSDTLTSVIETYLSQRLGIEVGGLRRQELESHISSQETFEKLVEIMDEIEMARYGVSTSSAELQTKTNELLLTLEKELAV